MLTRRQFLVGGAALAGASSGCGALRSGSGSILVNDIHTQLNPTWVDRIVAPDSLERLQRVVREARAEGRALCVAGGRHAMGGQQFGAGTVLVDMSAMARVLRLDVERGEVEVEAGIRWPALVEFLVGAQAGRQRQWGIAQKQAGADRLSLGGSLAANVHGRGLRLKPFIADAESFILVDARGNPRRCDRRENRDLFHLAAGGYGLFGVIAAVTLRLAPRRKLERAVAVLETKDLVAAFEARIGDGYLFGDVQLATDERSDDFFRKGVLTCDRPLPDDAAMPAERQQPSLEDWTGLLSLFHTDKRRAFEALAGGALSTSGHRYWSDTSQLGVYLDNYHHWLDRQLGVVDKGTEVTTELIVPRRALAPFLEAAREDFRAHGANVISATVRLIERDDESFLAWAREASACVAFNLHVAHTPRGLDHARAAFRRLIDLAIRQGGTYYLAYHRFATRPQVEACYPQFPELLRLKRHHDPEDRFQSDWYRHYRFLFADALPPAAPR